MSLKWEPLSERTDNTGHYNPPRWTCCSCYTELGDIGEGEHTCDNCGAIIKCERETVPSFVCTLVSAP